MTNKKKQAKAGTKPKKAGGGSKLPTDTRLPASYYFIPKKSKGKDVPTI